MRYGMRTEYTPYRLHQLNDTLLLCSALNGILHRAAQLLNTKYYYSFQNYLNPIRMISLCL